MIKNNFITLAGGCFWCTEAIFKLFKGIVQVKSGYIGGTKMNPIYEEVCAGNTGHAEAVRINFNSNLIKIEDIFNIFFATHDPTQLNRQGNDIGSQYRSSIFLENKTFEKQATEAISKAQNLWDDKIVTTIEIGYKFYSAEIEHEDYFANNPSSMYCRAIIDPKVNKARQYYKHLIK